MMCAMCVQTQEETHRDALPSPAPPSLRSAHSPCLVLLCLSLAEASPTSLWKGTVVQQICTQMRRRGGWPRWRWVSRRWNVSRWQAKGARRRQGHVHLLLQPLHHTRLVPLLRPLKHAFALPVQVENGRASGVKSLCRVQVAPPARKEHCRVAVCGRSVDQKV